MIEVQKKALIIFNLKLLEFLNSKYFYIKKGEKKVEFISKPGEFFIVSSTKGKSTTQSQHYVI